MTAVPLLSDPVFQLNLALWMLVPLPPSAPIRPVLREAGYALNSVGRSLHFPLGLRPRIAEVLGSADAPAPDVVAEGADLPYLLVECKGSSFGPDSSSARQASKLLAAAADLTDSLALPPGEARPGFVAYLTVAADAGAMTSTLRALSDRVEREELPSGEAGVLAVDRSTNGVDVQIADDTWPSPLRENLAFAVTVLRAEPEDDPQPLYLIPWDPGVQQDEDEKERGRNILFARILSEAAGMVGRASVPGEITLGIDELLSKATFDVFRRWRDRGETRKIRSACWRLVVEALADLPEDASVRQIPESGSLEVSLQTADARQKTADRLVAADPREGPDPDAPDQGSLFEG